MIKIYTVLSMMILLVGCGNDTHLPGSNVEPMPNYSEANAFVPYSFERHIPLLDNAKLQYPDRETVIQAGEFAGYESDFFYSDASGNMYFSVHRSVSEKKIRSELRAIQEWSTAEITPHNWSANLKLFVPDEGVTSYTWMQIHGSNKTYNFPLLRLVWIKNYSGKKDHIWAIIIINPPIESNSNSSHPDVVNTYNWVDLGRKPTDYFNAKVEIQSNLMVISIDDIVKVSTDVSYWGSVQNYFKGGIYINRPDDQGVASIIFKDMEM